MFGPEIGTIPIANGTATRLHPEFRRLVRARLSAERVVEKAIEKAQSARVLPEGNRIRPTMGAWALMIGIAFLLLDRVLEAVGVRTTAGTGADLATGMLMGSAAEPVTQAALALVAAQLEKGEALDLEAGGFAATMGLAEPAPDVLSATLPTPDDPGRVATVLRDSLSGLHEPPAPYARATRAIARHASLRRAALVAPALRGARVLWIDDEPAGNKWERATLEALGVEVTAARSTIEALKRLSADPFDLILSDIKREGIPDEGVTALPRLRQVALARPVVFYVGRVERSAALPRERRA